MSDPEVMEYRNPLPLPPDAALYAGIDVGSNTVKMVIADLGGGRANRVYEASLQSRLGEGMMAQARRLREVPILRTLDAFDHFLAAARSYPVRETVAIGTAALRDAENRADFLRRVEERCGLKIEIIPGEEEARLSYFAVRGIRSGARCRASWRSTSAAAVRRSSRARRTATASPTASALTGARSN